MASAPAPKAEPIPAAVVPEETPKLTPSKAEPKSPAPSKPPEPESEGESWDPDQDRQPRHDQESKPKAESGDKEIEWEKDNNLFDGDRTIKVKGKIKLEFRSVAIGLDQMRYIVNWMPLDKNGKVAKFIFRTKKGNSHAAGTFFPARTKEEKTIEPPYENKHGWQARIWIPPQEAAHGNSRGMQIQIFVPKGSVID